MQGTQYAPGAIMCKEHFVALQCPIFNPFKPNGISYSYPLDQSISVLRVVGWYFSFYSNFNRTFCKQTVETLIRRRVLIWVCTVYTIFLNYQ